MVGKKQRIINIFRYTTLILVAIIMMYPLFWLISGLWKTNAEIFTSASLIPSLPQDAWNSVVEGWTTRTGMNLGQYFVNTLKFLLPRVVGTVVSCTITAYAVTRFRFTGRKLVFTLIIATLLMPDVIFRIPMFMIWRDLGLFGTSLPLWLDSFFATASFFIFMLIQFLRTVPRDLDEAAKMDGSNAIQTLVYILIPVMKPAIITVGLLTFMWGMNDFMGPLIYIRQQVDFPLALGLRLAADTSAQGVYFRHVFASALIALVPSVTLFFLAQRYFIDGIATTGSKG